MFLFLKMQLQCLFSHAYYYCVIQSLQHRCRSGSHWRTSHHHMVLNPLSCGNKVYQNLTWARPIFSSFRQNMAASQTVLFHQHLLLFVLLLILNKELRRTPVSWWNKLISHLKHHIHMPSTLAADIFILSLQNSNCYSDINKYPSKYPNINGFPVPQSTKIWNDWGLDVASIFTLSPSIPFLTTTTIPHEFCPSKSHNPEHSHFDSQKDCPFLYHQNKIWLSWTGQRDHYSYFGGQKTAPSFICSPLP